MTEEYVAEPCYTPCPFNSGRICRAMTRCGMWSTTEAEYKIVQEEQRGIVESDSLPDSWPKN